MIPQVGLRLLEPKDDTAASELTLLTKPVSSVAPNDSVKS